LAALTLLTATVAIVALTPAAAVASSACVEYVVVPSCQPPDPGTGSGPGAVPNGGTTPIRLGNGGEAANYVARVPTAASTAAPSATLPFTGYPANSLIVLILALLAAALLVRLLLAIDRRLRTTPRRG
jgi:hypothetical protein